MLNACKQELMVLKDLNVHVHIYNSKQDATPGVPISPKVSKSDEIVIENTPSVVDNSEKALSENENTEQPLSVSGTSNVDFEFATFHAGRPNVEELLKEAVSYPGSLAVVCCGPPVLVDTARDQTATAVIKNPSNVIEYLEEYQAW